MKHVAPVKTEQRQYTTTTPKQEAMGIMDIVSERLEREANEQEWLLHETSSRNGDTSIHSIATARQKPNDKYCTPVRAGR